MPHSSSTPSTPTIHPADAEVTQPGLLQRLRSLNSKKRRSLLLTSPSPATTPVEPQSVTSPRSYHTEETAVAHPKSEADSLAVLASEATYVAPTAAAPAQDDDDDNGFSATAETRGIQFGSQVLIFSPDQKNSTIQSRIDDVYKDQVKSEFGSTRWAFFFKPGKYDLDIKLGYYTTCHGLGTSPSDVVITGSVRIKGDRLPNKNCTLNFWRGVENLTIVPTLTEDDRKVIWAVSQGTFFRRIHVKGDMVLSDGDGWSSGGYIADCIIDGNIANGTQQQFFIRNTNMGSFTGGSYAQVFVGCNGAPKENWPAKSYSVTKATPRVKEKPRVIYDDNKYWMIIPELRESATGPSWDKSSTNRGSHSKVRLATFHIADPSRDNATTLNAALDNGKSILFLPGVYLLNFALQVTKPNTVLLGLGLATLRPAHGTACITTDDVDGITLAGLILEAGPHLADTLCSIGDAKSSEAHEDNPTVLSDLFLRVGGAVAGRCHSQLLINLRHTIMDHTWLWRADHGEGADWYGNQCSYGCIVNANDVTSYAMFNEHNQSFQLLWNGNGGAVYFYQSELPYDPPGVKIWSHSNRKGYPSYKVSPAVTSHYAKGLGIYSVFSQAGVTTFTAVEHPTVKRSSEGTHAVIVRHVTICRFGGAADTGITHIINEKGGDVGPTNQRAQLMDVYQ